MASGATFGASLQVHNMCGEIYAVKEPHSMVGLDRVVTSGNLCCVMVITLIQNSRGVGSNPTLGAIFPIFITSMPLVP